MSVEAVQAAVSERFPQAATANEAGSAPEPSANEFVIFSKPELGRLGEDDTAKVWDLFAAAFANHAVTVHRLKILTGPELERLGAMQEHYGVINQISRLGRPALTEAAEQALQEQYAESIEDALVLGGHQFLDRYPDFSPFALAMLFSNSTVSRLGPGTYAGAVRIDADQVIILNGFHPRQLGFFTAEHQRVLDRLGVLLLQGLLGRLGQRRSAEPGDLVDHAVVLLHRAQPLQLRACLLYTSPSPRD